MPVRRTAFVLLVLSNEHKWLTIRLHLLAESKLTKLRASIEDKKNRIYFQQSYRDKCQQFIQLQNEYTKLLQQSRPKPHPALEVGVTPQGGILETSTTIAIKGACEKLKEILRQSILEGTDPQPDELAKFRHLLEKALQNASPHVFLTSLDALMRMAAARLRMQADEIRDSSDEAKRDADAQASRDRIQAQLQRFREQHVARFVETERLLNEAAELREKTKQVLLDIECRLEEQFPKDDSYRQLVKYVLLIDLSRHITYLNNHS